MKNKEKLPEDNRGVSPPGYPPYTITFVTPFGLEPKGTASARALPLAKALVARGHSVTLLVPPWNDRRRSGQTWDDEGVRVVNLDVAALPAFDPLVLTTRIARTVWHDPPDVLHTFKPKAYSGLIAALWWNARHLWPGDLRLVMDTDDWEGPGGWNELEPYPRLLQRVFTRQERYGLTHAHAVTVASRTLESIVWSHGVSPACTRYVPNGPGFEWSSPEESAVADVRRRYGFGDAPLVLLYTRFFEFTLERVVAVWQRVTQSRPKSRLLVVGEGLFGEERRFQALLRAAHLADTVTLAGWIAPDDLPAHLAAADLALYPMDDTLVNRTKCPVKLADLLAAGVPVVGEAVGQVTDYLAEDAGVLVPSGDVDGFAERVVALLDAPRRRLRIGDAAQRRLRDHFDWPVQAARLESLYRDLIRSK